jgi:hypothetical protein
MRVRSAESALALALTAELRVDIAVIRYFEL